MKVTEESKEKYNVDVIRLTLSNKMIISKIKTTVSEFLNIDESEFYNKSRRREIVTMKQVSAYFIRRYIKNISYAVIGQQFNNLDHATILYGVRKVNDIMDCDKEFKLMVEKINTEIREFVASVTENRDSDNLIDLNQLNMIDVSNEKKVIFVGFSELEMAAYQEFFKAESFKKFNNTGIYLSDKM